MRHKCRCELHGGKSTGARTAEGMQKLRDIHWKHGQRSQEQIETNRYYMRELKKLELMARLAGLLG